MMPKRAFAVTDLVTLEIFFHGGFDDMSGRRCSIFGVGDFPRDPPTATVWGEHRLQPRVVLKADCPERSAPPSPLGKIADSKEKALAPASPHHD
jgi:hypothetical protein